MNMKALAAAACVAFLPMTAGAVTFSGIFSPPTSEMGPVYLITDDGTQGDAIVRVDSSSAAPAMFSWTFEAVKPLRVTGTGTLLAPGFLTAPEVTFDGVAAAFALGAGGNFTYEFQTVSLFNAGDTVIMTVGFGGFAGTGNQSSTFAIDITTTPIPLPAAGWLLISGLGGVALLGRRRNQVV